MTKRMIANPKDISDQSGIEKMEKPTNWFRLNLEIFWAVYFNPCFAVCRCLPLGILSGAGGSLSTGSAWSGGRGR